MDLLEENKKRKEFRQILKDLAKSQTELKDKNARVAMYKRLEKLYYAPDENSRYRHFYSDIFSVLVEIQNGTAKGSIEILGQNLSEIRKGYKRINKDSFGNLIDVSGSINKLYDHVSLDIARMGYSDAGDWKLSQKEEIKQIKAKVSLIGDSATKLEADNKRMQRDYIAILGVFAAILVTFFSGLGFSVSVLGNIEKASIYRLILGIMLLGIVLTNMLGMLVNFIREMVDKDSIHKWLICLANFIFFILLIVLYLAWKYSWLGHQSF